MDEVSLDDGLDGTETLVLGLGVPETAVLVTALLGAWACVAGLPAAAGWPAAVLLAAGGALLGWGRHDGRTILGWTLRAAAFAWRQRRRSGARPTGALASLSSRVRDRARGLVRPPRSSSLAGERGALVLPLVLPRHAPPGPRSGARVVTLVSLRGGSGRSTLGCALATRLALDGRLPGARGWRRLRVVLVDADATLPGASLAWGAPLGGAPQRHRSAAVVHPAPAAGEVDVAAALERGAAGADVVVLDAPWRPGGDCAALQRCDDILVLLEPTPAGVLDAYRSVAWLRRLGLRDRLLLVANRCDDGTDLAEVEGDLGLRVVARVPRGDLESADAVAALAALLNRRMLGGLQGAGAVPDAGAEAG